MTDRAALWSELAGRPGPPAAITPTVGAPRSPPPPPPSAVVSVRPPAVPKSPTRPTLPAAADARDGTLGNYPLTELGTAHRFLALYGDLVRFVPELEAWLNWDADHWVWDRDGAATRVLASQLYQTVYAEGVTAGVESGKFATWARECQKETVIRRIVSLTSDQPEARLSLADVDGDASVVGLDGARQVINLRSGEVRPAERLDFVTRSLAPQRVGVAGGAIRWRSFLSEVFDYDNELIDWLQRFLGYALTGLIDEQIFLFAFGLGANGKSVLLRVLGNIWGDYARVIQPETLMLQTRTSSGPTPDLARLAGARLVLGSETEEGKALSEALVKQLTGGDTLTARELYAAPFEFRPAFKLILAGNHRPSIRGTDHGIWRRIRLLPFTRRFAQEQQDPGMAEKLLAESDDILAWLVEGAERYLRHGLGITPRCVLTATEIYRSDEDVVGEWMAERTDPSGVTQSAVLYADFQGWCSQTGHESLTVQSFGRRLAERGLPKDHSRAGAKYLGISLVGTLC